MIYVLYTIFFLSCMVLVGSVLLQPGKTDAGALFTSNVSSSAFAPRGTATVLSKITIVAAAVFMMSALFIAMPAFTGNISVLSTTGETPADTANSNTADANANTAATDTNANSAAPPDTNANANAAQPLVLNPVVDANTAANANAASNSNT